MTAIASSICSSSVGAPIIGSDSPEPRRSKVITRAKRPIRSPTVSSVGSVNRCSHCEIQVGTQRRSIGASPSVTYAMLTSPLFAYRAAGPMCQDVTVRREVPSKRKASDVFVECLEAEGVKHVFGIPGEETLDLNESLARSSIEFVPVRHAFKVAEGEKPGATHIELPEDVMEAEIDAEPLPNRRLVRPEPAARELMKAADTVRGALNPVALAGNGVIRGGATPALREFVRATGIPVAETFMGKGLLDPEDPKALGSVGLQSGDYSMAGFDDADVVLAIGYDLVEHSPEHWNPNRDKKIICIDSVPAEIDAFFMPEVELVGDLYHILTRLGEECRHVPHQGGSPRLREVVMSHLEAAKDNDQFPVQPPRALYEIRKALGRNDILISDVGLHKLWIGRMFPAYEPNTVLIANGLAG